MDSRCESFTAIVLQQRPSAISYSGNTIFGYNFHGGEYRLDVFLPDKDFWPEVEIAGNQLSASISNFWDIEFKTNWVKFRRHKGDVFLCVDFRGDDVSIDGFFTVLGEEIDLKDRASRIGSSRYIDCEVIGGGIGMSLGPRGRILRPNYAMQDPKPMLYRW